MASPFAIFLLCLSSLLSLSMAKPNSLVLPVKKDKTTLQYVTRIQTRTPLVPVNLVIDLGGRYIWIDCESNYVSSSYQPVHCNTPQCSLITSPFGCGQCYQPSRPGCSNSSCGAMPENPNLVTVGELGQDAFAFPSTDGSSLGPSVSTRNYIFSCAPNSLLEGLAKGVQGMAGLGRNRIAVPIQLAVEFALRPKFAICLPSSASPDGVLFFGDGKPYESLPNVGIPMNLAYTPLLVNNVSTAGSSTAGERSVEHFIGVSSIKVDDKSVPDIDVKLLSFDKNGVGGTKVSTIAPYTVMETSIYKAVNKAFGSAMGKIKAVAPVSPFKLCYNKGDIACTRAGPDVPSVDLVLQNETVYWRMFGANMMVEAKAGVLCLGFVDGGANPRTSIVIGGFQLENNLLEFDLKNRMLGFSSSLLYGSRQTTCANFNNFLQQQPGMGNKN